MTRTVFRGLFLCVDYARNSSIVKCALGPRLTMSGRKGSRADLSHTRMTFISVSTTYLVAPRKTVIREGREGMLGSIGSRLLCST